MTDEENLGAWDPCDMHSQVGVDYNCAGCLKAQVTRLTAGQVMLGQLVAANARLIADSATNFEKLVGTLHKMQDNMQALADRVANNGR